MKGTAEIVCKWVIGGVMFGGLVLMCWQLAYGATIPAPTAFLIAQKAPQNGSFTCTWTLPAHYTTSPVDSSNLIWYSGSDTLFSLSANLGVGAVSKVLNGLQPNRQYILGIRLRRGDSTVVSNKDTMYTALPQVEKMANVTPSEYMQGARAWSASSIRYDSLYVSTASGLDSTWFYCTAPYTGLQVYVTGAADSCKVLLYVFKGHAEDTNLNRETGILHTGKFEFGNAWCDTINITRLGWTDPKLLNITAGDHFYIRADGQTNNGWATILVPRLYRRGQ